MKQNGIPGTPAQTTARSGTGASGGKASVNQTGTAAALQSAGTVVAHAERKKGIDKNPARIEAEGAVPDLPAGPRNSTDAGPPVLAGQVLSPGQEKQQRKNTPDVVPRATLTTGADPGKVGRDRVDLHEAVAFDAKSKGKEPVTEKPRRHRPQRPQQEGKIGLLPDAEEKRPSEKALIPGVDDRVPYMAMAPGASMPLLRSPKLTKASTVKKLKPKSRAECHRRCGSNGFCDPSSALGCGGVYCGRKNDGV
jgi:hypothetical protein